MTQEKGHPDQTSRQKGLPRLALACAVATFGIGVLVIIGWLLDIQVLKSLSPGLVSMRFNTAIGFVLIGGGLWLAFAGHRRASQVCGGAALLLGLITLGEYLFGWRPGIDLLFYNEKPGDLGISSTGRMAPMAAACFVLAGMLLLSQGYALRLRQVLVLALGAFGLQVLAGYSFGSAALYELPQHVAMALHTALGFLLFAVGQFCLMPEGALLQLLTGGRAGSILARRMLPAIFLVPLLVTWLRLYGQAQGWYSVSFGLSLGVVTVISVQMLMMFWALDALNRKEQEEVDKRLLLGTVLDSLGEGVVAMDCNLRMNTYNRTAEEMLGLGAASETVDKWGDYYGVFDPDTGQPLDPAGFPLVQAIAGKAVTDVRQFIRNHRRPEGVHINVSAFPMLNEDKAIVGAVAVFSDVTEKRRVQRQIELEASYSRAHGAALALFNEGLLNRGRLLPAFLRLLDESLGHSPALFYRYDDWRGCFELEATHGASDGLRLELQRGEPWLRRTLNESQPFVVDQSRVLVAGGESGVELLVLPVHYQDMVLGMLLLAARPPIPEPGQDFLRRLCAQLATTLHNLRQYENTRMLANQLRLRNEEIARKNQELESANQLKSEFLANMSHELRTPLNAIIGFSEILGDGILGVMTPKQTECIRDIHDSGQHLLELINDILDLSKIEAGRLTLDLEQQDLVLLLRNALTIVKERAMSNQLSLALELPATSLVLEMDPRRVKQIVYNLLSNAVKFTPHGGRVELALRRLNGAELQALAVNFRSGEAILEVDYAGIIVSDTGIGISTTAINRLFQPFVQLDSSLSRQYTGTGLGLAIVRRMTELHGGVVTVVSATGEGSQFGIWLPLLRVEAQPALLVEDTGKPLALIVEDDKSHAEMIRLILEEEGFQALIACDGESAVRLAAQYQAELITLDLELPDMDGWATLLELKALPQHRATPVVIISISGQDNVKKGLSLGASGVLPKPLDRIEFNTLLDRLGVGQLGKHIHRVLIVDDDPQAIDILHTYLREIPGVEVVSACGGEEGVALANELLPDLLVVDLLMPVVSGFEVVQALQRNPAAAAIPVIVVTAKELSAEERQQLQGNVRLIIEKAQFTRQGFLNEVRRAMRVHPVQELRA